MAEPPIRLLGSLRIRGGDTRIGAFTSVSHQVESQGATVGRYCEIGPGVVLGATGHPLDWLGISPFQYKATAFSWHPTADAVDVIDPEAGGRDSFRGAPSRIGNDVWIGAGAVILRGVSVGDGAVIAANCVVNRDVGPYEVVGGVPVRTIRHKVPEALRRELGELAWWRFTPNQLSGIAFDEVALAVQQLRERVPTLDPYEPAWETLTRGVPGRNRRRFGRRN